MAHIDAHFMSHMPQPDDEAERNKRMWLLVRRVLDATIDGSGVAAGDLLDALLLTYIGVLTNRPSLAAVAAVPIASVAAFVTRLNAHRAAQSAQEPEKTTTYLH